MILERAYDLGFVANENGTVDFPDPIVFGDEPIHYIIDLNKVTPSAEADHHSGPPTEDDASTDDALGIAPMLIHQNNYSWANASNTILRRFGPPTYHPPFTSGFVNQDGVRRIGKGSHTLGSPCRTNYWYVIDQQGNGYWEWSQWRAAGSTGIFSRNVTARRAQVEVW